MFDTVRRGCAQAGREGFCSSSGEERLARLFEDSRSKVRASFKEVCSNLANTEKAQQELKGDSRELMGQANATIFVSFGAYVAPIFAFTALANACGFFDKSRPREV